ncbi:hypothetical protein CTAYLR_002565 [Chrysophaeum taylorii]|uniref:CH-like domain-containing protein n=1 Tax=Chrysophaeum taylorii TaxID=2483200 RepID=A0AAD7UH83_9STRA|nr:hypothetical protein CTAYLR_002565 [Chrysophaeum taylorii]
MHSYDNGIALRIKKDNWSQLLKFFKKVGLEDLISQQEVNAIIYCEDGAVVGFVNRMYETLTQRTVQKVARRPLLDKAPPFARDTGSAVMRNSMRSAILAETSDELSRQMELEARVHERSLQEEKSHDRFRGSTTTTRNARGPSRTVGARAPPVAQVTVKEIEVRQVDRSLAQLRSPPVVLDYAAADDVPLREEEKARDVDDVLRECVLDGGCEAPSDASSADVARAFAASIGESDGVPEATAVAVYGRLADRAATLAVASLAMPEHYSRVSEVYAAALLLKTDVFDAAVAASWAALGREMRRRDPRASTSLFVEKSLPPLLPLLRLDTKRRAVLGVLCDFVDQDSERRVELVEDLKRLVLPETNVFLSCVATLVRLDFKAGRPHVDFHLYYISQALAQHDSPRLRAAAVAALTAAATTRPRVLAPYVPTIALLARQDKAWETQAQIVLLAAAALSPDTPYLPEIRATFLTALTECFRANAPSPVRLVGLKVLAPILQAQDPALQKAYVDVLSSLQDQERDSLFFAGADNPLVGDVISNFDDDDVPSQPLQELIPPRVLLDILATFAQGTTTQAAIVRLLDNTPGGGDV